MLNSYDIGSAIGEQVDEIDDGMVYSLVLFGKIRRLLMRNLRTE
jgi:hypothetical protein